MAVLLIAGPFLLPEYRSDGAGRLDPASVAMALVAILGVVYAVKEFAAYGAGLVPLLAAVLGVTVGAAFLRRQRTLTQPLLDLTLFARRAFSVALGAQTMALFVAAGIQFFVLQYMQLVLGLSPLQAGLWSVPAMIAGVAGTLMAPVLVRWIRAKPVLRLLYRMIGHDCGDVRCTAGNLRNHATFLA